jgi:hypothetical protein
MPAAIFATTVAAKVRAENNAMENESTPFRRKGY